MDTRKGEDFSERLIRFLRDLLPFLESESLPQKICDEIRDVMNVDDVYLIGAEGSLLANWKAYTKGWKPRQFSMDAIRKAISSKEGYYLSSIEDKPTESQIHQNILSCVAARIQIETDTIAAFYCDIRHGSRRFTENDASLLKALADLLAVYVRHYESRYETPPKESVEEKAHALLGECEVMRQLRAEITNVARRATRAILIYGERGAGKEIVARMLHDLSGRSEGRFIPVNCGAISTELFESEFFGHEKGAFSGAHQERKGKIRSAHKGTLFLDEVGDIPIEFQQKLLRALETKHVTPVGLDHEVGPVDFRLISATNKDLRELVSQKAFREDFYDRITGVVLHVPPLRKRPEDIPLLASHFAWPKRISPEAIGVLQCQQDWPGNVRKLRDIVETARDLSDTDTVDRDAISRQLDQQQLLASDKPPVKSAATQSAFTITFHELKSRWKHKQLGNAELDQILYPAYHEYGSWKRVGQRKFGLKTDSELREFVNWVYQRQIKKEMSGSYADYAKTQAD